MEETPTVNPTCAQCGKVQASPYNCTWECRVAWARSEGAREHLPNGLPVRCIRADGLLLEHEHGAHRDYKFPVEVNYIGAITEDLLSDYQTVVGTWAQATEENLRRFRAETHGLIYSDGCIAVTLHEHCYAMWLVSTGHFHSGSLWAKGDWQLTEESLLKIRERFPWRSSESFPWGEPEGSIK